MNFISFFIKKIFLKKKYFSLFFILFIITAIHYNFFGIKSRIYLTYPNLQSEARKIFFSKKSVLEHNHFKNDYNVKFLPETQYVKLNFEKKKLIFSDSFYSEHPRNFKFIAKTSTFIHFYIELMGEKIWIVDYLGNIYPTEIQNIKDKKKINLKTISSNLSVRKVLDILIYNNYLFVSFSGGSDDCHTLNIVKAKVNLDHLNFENFFSSDECGAFGVSGGRMQFYRHDNSDGLLITNNASHFVDKPDNFPQDENSIYGKIIFIDFKKKNSIIFSKGHRALLGLYADEKVILSTENAAYGGDEINKIIFNENYGWPIASYGEKYSVKAVEPVYSKSHISLGFKEPIFAFISAIGISEIIKLPNDFSNHFIDNFIVSSLWGSTLYRIKFDKNYNRIIYYEKILIGQRIRDLKYHHKMKAILLALEQEGELGIIFNNDK